MQPEILTTVCLIPQLTLYGKIVDIVKWDVTKKTKFFKNVAKIIAVIGIGVLFS